MLSTERVTCCHAGLEVGNPQRQQCSCLVSRLQFQSYCYCWLPLGVMYTPLNIKSQGGCLLFLTLENVVVDLDV